jgi:hypothetical protein
MFDFQGTVISTSVPQMMVYSILICQSGFMIKMTEYVTLQAAFKKG